MQGDAQVYLSKSLKVFEVLDWWGGGGVSFISLTPDVRIWYFRILDGIPKSYFGGTEQADLLEPML